MTSPAEIKIERTTKQGGVLVLETDTKTRKIAVTLSQGGKYRTHYCAAPMVLSAPITRQDGQVITHALTLQSGERVGITSADAAALTAGLAQITAATQPARRALRHSTRNGFCDACGDEICYER